MNMVDLYFPSSTGVSVIAEPGSFFVSSAFSFAVNIISKEVVARDGQDQAHGEFHFFFKSFICIYAVWVLLLMTGCDRVSEMKCDFVK